MHVATVGPGMDMSFRDLVRAPKVELPGGARRWVDVSLQLLVDHFGTDMLRRPAVVPGEFVPAGYDGSEAAAREVCLKVSERMGIPSAQIAHANAALDEKALDTPTVETFGYLGEHAVAEALAVYRFRQHRLIRDGPLLPEWHQALDPEPRARFVARLDELIGGPPTVLGW